MKKLSVITHVIFFAWLAFATQSFAEQLITVDQAAANTKEAVEKREVTSPAVSVKNVLVDLNLASREQLMTLPGIGEDEAMKIIAGRPYQMKTQLITKQLISSALFYQIASDITIDWVAFNKLTVAKKKAAEAQEKKKEKKAFKAMMSEKIKTVKTRSGLSYQDLAVGTGTPAQKESTVSVNYTVWLKNGTKIESSVGKQPFTFVLGTGQVIRGWDEGILTMKAGGKRRLIIPANLAYGKEGSNGKIPPNSTLIFELELVKVELLDVEK